MAPRPLPPLDIQTRTSQYVERTAGLHLSQITNDILIGLDPDRYGESKGGPKWMNFWAGLLFERVLELAWVDKELNARPGLIRPGEVKLDGVLGTPDAYDTWKGRPEEYKCTKKSCRQDINDRKFWIYWVQLKAYAYMMGCNSGALYILHINGNYNRGEGADDDPDAGYVIKGWEDTWNDTQLEENWAMLVNHAKSRRWL